MANPKSRSLHEPKKRDKSLKLTCTEWSCRMEEQKARAREMIRVVRERRDHTAKMRTGRVLFSVTS
jgi:hypothetical protein